MINIAEYVSSGVIAQIQNNIGAALDLLVIDRPDGKVTLENPKEESYFNYENAIGYKTPAVFVVPTSVDFKLNRGPNHVNATVGLFVSVIVEDRNQSLLQLKCFRYADALHRVLNRAVLSGSGHKSVIKPIRMAFSGTESNKSTVDSSFRKEATILLEVEHYDLEN